MTNPQQTTAAAESERLPIDPPTTAELAEDAAAEAAADKAFAEFQARMAEEGFEASKTELGPDIGDAIVAGFADAKARREAADQEDKIRMRRMELVTCVNALLIGGHARADQPHNAVLMARHVLASVDFAMLDGEADKAGAQ